MARGAGDFCLPQAEVDCARSTLGVRFMRVRMRLLAIAFFALLIGEVAWAQEPKGFLGVELKAITKEEAEKLGWEVPRGAKVVKPREGGPAAGAGILAEDVIVSLDGQEVESLERFIAAIGAKTAGAQVRLRLLRSGKERSVTVTLGARPAELAQESRNQPILQLDTGGHMAIVKGLAFTPDGNYLVSSGEDKVIRVWDWKTGRTVRTIRGQSGRGFEGKILTMALSPDGRLLAVAGWLEVPGEQGHVVRVYEFATGGLLGLLRGGHVDTVYALEFSPDGKRLMSGSSDHSAIIWDVERRQLVHRLEGHKHSIYGVGFTQDGARVVTASHDATLKVWSTKDGKEIATLTGHGDKIRSLSISPVDGTIASGDLAGTIRLWTKDTWRSRGVLARQPNEVGALAFSPDGKLLLSSAGLGASPAALHVWEIASGRDVTQGTVQHDNTSFVATWRPQGDRVATGGFSGDVQIWDPRTGRNEAGLRGTGAQIWATCFAPDSRTIYWGQLFDPASQNVLGPMQASLRLPASGQPLGQPERLAPDAPQPAGCGRETAGEWSLTHTQGGEYGYDDGTLEVRRGGAVVAGIVRDSTSGYRHRSYSLTASGEELLSGGDGGVLVRYRLDGTVAQSYRGHESEVWTLSPSPDGRFLLSGSADQTVRLWNLQSGELIVTLFHGRDGEWVMWTPQGYYTSSPGADKIVGWQINNGPDQAADYVGAEQLRQHLHRPDIVERAIVLASAAAAVREAPGTAFQLSDLLARPVPRFTILSPPPDKTERGGRTIVRIAVEATPDPIKAIRVQVNGRQVEEQTPDIGSGGFKPGEHMLSVPLARGRNEVRISLTNVIGEKAETVALTHDGEGDLDKRGTLYVLAIGVDKYPGLGSTCGASGAKSCDLSFPGADARALVQAVEKRLGPAHTNVVKRVLVNGAEGKDSPTATNILDAIDLLKHAKETDTVMVFIAGHGFNDGPNYRFLATNAEWSGGALRGSTVVSWQVLQEAVETAKGRRILFIDTCHSGNAYNQRLGNAAYHANIIAYTAARFDQEAIENPTLGHGLFTYAVVEGLEGKGEFDAKRQISTRELADYVVKRVDQLAKSFKGQQEPQYFRGRDAEDYVLARW